MITMGVTRFSCAPSEITCCNMRPNMRPLGLAGVRTEANSNPPVGQVLHTG